MKKNPIFFRSIPALLLALLLLVGCGGPVEQPVETTVPQVTEATEAPLVTEEPTAPPPQQDPHDELPTQAPETQPVETQPTQPQPTSPAETQPTYPVETQPFYPVETQPTYPEPTYPVETQPVQPQPTQPVQPQPTQPVETQPPEPVQPQPTQPPVSGSFEVHFIDVGQADAALVLCDGMSMLIDGGNAEDSSLMYTYLKNRNITKLDYVIGTHAHEDHIGGIAGALNYASVVTTYCPVTSYDTRAFSNFVKAANRHSSPIIVPNVGDRFSLGSADCQILGVNSADDPNNSSIVLRITYGQTSFLFTGDAEREAEQVILDRGYDLRSDVLKVGHHGSASSTSYYWLRQVAPKYAVISVGTGNSYGHPTETVLSRLRDAEVTTFRTDLQGDIICTSDGQNLSFTVSRNQDADTLGGIGGNSTQPDTPSGESQYVLNTNTRKFHYPHCSSAKKISDKNRQDYFGSRDDLISQGYDPCGNCKP